jgi:glycerophosphoryl diester phosphodiesterase
LTLERTTNVEEVYPDRFVTEGTQRHWYVADFTLAEIKRLDAGSWFNDKFRGAQVPTWQEAVELVKGNAGLYPETKAPEVYGSRGFDMEKLLVENLRQNNLDMPSSEAKTPIIIQSFSAASLRRLQSEFKVHVPLVLLVEQKDKDILSPRGLQEIRTYAAGIGPAKEIIDQNPPIVRYAHDAGLSVTPYTFRSTSTGVFKRVRDEMEYFLAHLNVDAVFTDNPDEFPR